MNSVYVVLLLNLYRNVSPNSIFLCSKGGSYASEWSVSTDEVVKVPVYILILSLCTLSSFFSRLGEAVL